jgi:wobble nucleotide-excising tRNase
MKLLADYKNNKQDFILYNLTKKTSKNEIIDLKQNVLSFYKCIEEISKEAKSEIQEWEEIIKQYRTKFFCDTIDFEIDSSNTEDSVMIPKFKFYIKHSNKPLDDATKKRLSSGEKKVLLILNILFEVEISKKMNKPFIVILDDIVESFDYKNKYAVLNYIREISDNDLVQIFIFTHNFDFYRDCQRLMDTSLSSHMFADKILNSDGTVKEIKFEEISNKYKDYKFLQD